MSTADALIDACDRIQDALLTVEGVRPYTDLGAVLDPPATVLGPPTLTWTGVGSSPSEARFLVIVAEQADDGALPRLWALVPLVVEALEDIDNAAVVSAAPGTWTTGGTDLPCYEITLEMAL